MYRLEKGPSEYDENLFTIGAVRLISDETNYTHFFPDSLPPSPEHLLLASLMQYPLGTWSLTFSLLSRSLSSLVALVE